MLDTGSWLVVALACIAWLALQLYVKHQDNADLRDEVIKLKGQLASRESELVVSRRQVERLNGELATHRKARKYGVGGGVGGYSRGGNPSMILPPSTTILFDHHGMLDPEVVARLFGVRHDKRKDRTIEELKREAEEAVAGLGSEAVEEEAPTPEGL